INQRNKQNIAAWLVRSGRSDFVDGYIDGVNDQIDHKTIEKGAGDPGLSLTESAFSETPMILYDSDRDALEAIKSTIARKFDQDVKCHIHSLQDTAWQNAWTGDFQEWSTDRFRISPIAMMSKAYTDSERKLTPIYIDGSNGAFGTGQHQTTRCLMSVIETNLQNWNAKSVLDVGTGTGILLIACQKLGAKICFGTEIDDDLVSLAQRNGEANHVQLNVFNMTVPKFTRSFDLVIANILVPVLHDLFADLQSLVAANGRLMLAGFIEKEAGPLKQLACDKGMRLESETELMGWHVLVFAN
ncbi:MAG: 50S ribosomal protein L11 methyltransferase, partial [Proteobacteria bacterium]|nr:50S ribosomal protein L11 methyltransferase [Pseudomonadota bacterium]